MFPSADYALSFHVGLMARMFSRDRGRVDAEQEDRSAVAWRRWEQASTALDEGKEAEDFQAVGMRCRECLLELVRGFSTADMVPEGQAAPKRADCVEWTALIVGRVAKGHSADELRTLLRTQAKATWRYVNWLTHAKNAVRFDASIAVDATFAPTWIKEMVRWQG